MKMMSARALRQLSTFWQTGRLSQVYRCSSTTAGGDSKGAGGSEPPAQKASTSSSATESKQPPPPPPPPAEEPFDNSKYQATELYEYNPMSFFDMEVDMSVSRCPQPSSLRKAS